MDEDFKNSCQNCDQNRMWHDYNTVRELTVRLNRIEGQIRGIKRMIEEGVYCDKVINQITSAQSALYGAARLLLQKHMQSCVKEQLAAGNDQVIDEVLTTIFKMMR